MPFIIKEGESRPIVLTGPFRTGIILDSQKLYLEGYEMGQIEAVDALAKVSDGTWYYPRPRRRKSGLDIDVDDRR